MAIQNAPSENSDQTAHLCSLIWIFTGRMFEDMFSDIAAHLLHYISIY